MPTTPKYPAITDVTLTPIRALEVQLPDFPDLFERDDCPYPPAIRAFLAKMTGGSAAPPNYSDDELMDEISSLYSEVRNSAARLKSPDAKDQMQIFKTSSDLLSKLVALKERALNIRDMARFQKLVVQAVESVLTTQQRAAFIEILGKYVNVQ